MKIEQRHLLKGILVATTVLLAIAQEAASQTAMPTGPSRLKLMMTQAALKSTGKPGGQSSAVSIAAPGATTAVKSKITQHTYYTFTGKGNWSIAANWENNRVPPSILKPGDHIIINAKGTCLFNNRTIFTLVEESSLEIKPGSILYVSMGNNFILRGGVVTNNGTVSILSGVLPSKNTVPFPGIIKTSRLSGAGSKKVTQALPAFPGNSAKLTKGKTGI